MVLTLALAGVGVLLAAAICAVLTRRMTRCGELIYGISALVCAVLLVASIAQLVDGSNKPLAAALPLGVPWIGAHFRVDALSAFFLMIVNLGGAAASLYALGYGRHETAPQRVLPFFPMFLAGMNTVVLADDAFSFLLAWEFMSLSSWALVMVHHREADNARAGYIYLVMATFGTLSLLLGFGLLAGPNGQYSFEAIRQVSVAPGLAALILALALLGAGSKAGLVPLHVWLPLAHPAAPSHVSALMSGVMTKVAIYGFIRITFDLLGPPSWQWSIVILVLGAITAVLGLLHAVLQRDLKRLLAYSTVENIGIVFVGLGLAMAFRANGMAAAAALAMTASLLHVLNHALFKTLLFCGAGAVLVATGTRDMERLGGLIGRMPRTSLAFLVGAAAISALPPLNGFVSEWLIFQAILVSPDLPQFGLKFLVPAVGAMLALAAALAGACFVRAFGITFLGRPRSTEAETAREVDGFSTTVMLGLAALCVLAGILPGLIIDAIGPAIAYAVGGAQLPAQSGMPWLTLVPLTAARSSYNGLIVLAFICISSVFAVVIIHGFATRAVRRGPAWDCGFPNVQPNTQYSADSFGQPLRRVFGTTIFRARETVEMPPPGDLRPARHDVQMRDPIWETLYAPIGGFIGYATEHLNRLQFLTVRRYLTLVFGALVLLLMVIALWR